VVGRVSVQREVATIIVVVPKVLGEQSAEMVLAEDDHVVEAFTADGADQPLDVRILPGRSGRGEDLLDAHPFDPAPEVLAVDRVSVAKEESRCFVVGKRLDDLLGRPRRRRVLRDVEVDDLPWRRSRISLWRLGRPIRPALDFRRQ